MQTEIVPEIVSAFEAESSIPGSRPWLAITSRPDCKMSTGGSYGDVAVFDEVAVKHWEACDCGYEAWLQFVLDDDGKQSWSEHLPKIIWHSFELRLVILEKLEPTEFWLPPMINYPLGLGAICSSFYTDLRQRAPAWMGELYDQLKEIVARSAGGIYIDAHEGNWMQRPDGTIVVTDPLAPFE